jgi:hypothetical protein
MAKSVNKFIVKLTDVSQFQPKLMVTASPVKDKKNTFMVKIVHPNVVLGEDKKPLLVEGKKQQVIIHQEEFKSKEKDEIKGFIEAITYGKTLLELPDIQEVARNTKYVDQLFIPQGRRGKMKLKTKASEDARIAEESAMRLANDDEPMLEDDLDDVELEDTHDDDEDAAPVKLKKEKVAKTPKVLKVPKEKKTKLGQGLLKGIKEAVAIEAKSAKVVKAEKLPKEKQSKKLAPVKAKRKNNDKNKKVVKKTKATLKTAKNKGKKKK